MHSPQTHISSSITKLVFGLTLTLALLYSLFVLGYSWLIEDNIFNRLVAQQVSLIEQEYRDSGKIGAPQGRMYNLHKGWNEVPSEIKETHQKEPNRVEFNLSNGKTFHLAKFYLGNEEYVLLADVAGFEVSRDYLTTVVTWLGLFSLFTCSIIALLAWKMGRNISMPIEHLADAVRKVDSGDLTALKELAKHMPNNEVSTLAQAITKSLTELNDALSREVHFTKDISHEIRTPISVLQNVLSQTQLTNETIERQENLSISLNTQSVKQMKNATEALSQTTHVLLALARNESSFTECLSLNRLLENCVLNHFGLNHTANGQLLDLNINMPSKDVTISANRNLLEILVNNLLSNVVTHASGPHVEIILNESSLRFTNEFKRPLPENFEASGVRGLGSQGIGQGLSLIERICDTCQWQFLVNTNHKQGLFSVEVVFINK
ncbi:HAMP domain-containing protein [Paraferrimonas haliotis]|uniref:histidine kinase n=1 Tax=Paraferrimonas haliotis TaxID=2013866 RepID=A0AA37TYM5_9GAMM|nr:HAMP domain-containing protein [Paraferrimonas haliotis]GLS83696.1 two-component sensor histidine kinase [Paraferrimonas haliotis]